MLVVNDEPHLLAIASRMLTQLGYRAVTAVLDRLLHHCQVINIKGRSYRLKNYEDRNQKPPE